MFLGMKALGLLAAVAPMVSADVVTVGGSSLGWSTGVRYPSIAVQPGDKVLFAGFKGRHDVWRLPDDGACDFSNGGLLADTDVNSYEFDVQEADLEKTMFFGCSVGGHCVSGQKVEVRVVPQRPAFQAEATPRDADDGSTDLDAIPQAHCEPVCEVSPGVFKRWCISQPVTMTPGGMVNTQRRLAIPYPLDRPVIIEDMDADMVKATAEGLVPAPLSELYVHHFLTDVVKGEGAEFRRKPPPYGNAPGGVPIREIKMGAQVRDMAVFHWIDLRGVAPWLPCAECRCKGSDGKYLEYGMAGEGGGISCCTNCTSTSDAGAVDYFMQYTVKWSEFKSDTEIMTVVTTQFDAAEALGKRIEYQVPVLPSGVHAITLTSPMGNNGPEDMQLIMCSGHMHNGGISIRLSYADTDEEICKVTAIYGHTPNKAGDELGFLVGLTDHVFPQPLTIKRSTPVKVTATYNATEIHAGVMSLFNVDSFGSQMNSAMVAAHGKNQLREMCAGAQCEELPAQMQEGQQASVQYVMSTCPRQTGSDGEEATCQALIRNLIACGQKSSDVNNNNSKMYFFAYLAAHPMDIQTLAPFLQDREQMQKAIMSVTKAPACDATRRLEVASCDATREETYNYSFPHVVASPASQDGSPRLGGENSNTASPAFTLHVLVLMSGMLPMVFREQ